MDSKSFQRPSKFISPQIQLPSAHFGKFACPTQHVCHLSEGIRFCLCQLIERYFCHDNFVGARKFWFAKFSLSLHKMHKKVLRFEQIGNEGYTNIIGFSAEANELCIGLLLISLSVL